VDVVGHQTVSNELIAANRLIFAQNGQKFAVIIVVFEYSLFVDAAVDDMVDVERTDFARTGGHRRDLFLSWMSR
jgi:hypothetical protein